MVLLYLKEVIQKADNLRTTKKQKKKPAKCGLFIVTNLVLYKFKNYMGRQWSWRAMSRCKRDASK